MGAAGVRRKSHSTGRPPPRVWTPSLPVLRQTNPRPRPRLEAAMTLLQKVAARFDFRAAFRTAPVDRIADYSASHLRKGAKYHAGFERLPGRRMVWRAEQVFLDEFGRREGPFELHVDFAGGTGRIASALEPFCRAQIVLDVSEKMLAVARRHLRKARIVCADFRHVGRLIPPDRADLVTAFRFFPNAEAALRDDAMAFIAGILKPGGHLVCNNHRNFWSVPYVGGRLALSRHYTGGMTNKTMVRLAARHGLALVRTYSVGIIPQNERVAALPWRAVETIEKAVSRRWGSRHRAGYDVVFQFRKR